MGVVDVAVLMRHVELILDIVFHEVVVGDEAEAIGVDALADVLDDAVLLDLVEVVEAVRHRRARVVDPERHARQLSGEILRPVGKSVVVVVGKLARHRLEAEIIRLLVGESVERERDRVPRVGRRIAAVVLVEKVKAVAVRIERAVVEVPRIVLHVELPAVKDAIAAAVCDGVGVQTVDRKRVLPRIGDAEYVGKVVRDI